MLDAVVAQNSVTDPPLASDMQSLSHRRGISALWVSLLRRVIDWILYQRPSRPLNECSGSFSLLKEVLGLSIPWAPVFSAGILLKESGVKDFNYKQVHNKFHTAIQSMGSTLKCHVCTFMFRSI